MNDTESPTSDSPEKLQQARLWQGDGWTARVIKNEDDDGWAVAMVKDGEPEPALVGPWTMGRDKKNPKPLDEDHPHAVLSAHDDSGVQLARVQVAASFKLSRASAVAWADGDFAKPAQR